MLPPMKRARTVLLDTLDRMQVMAVSSAQQMEQYHSQDAPIVQVNSNGLMKPLMNAAHVHLEQCL
jgi:hypothetical protein